MSAPQVPAHAPRRAPAPIAETAPDATLETDDAFLALGAPPVLARALAARGYATPTAVQASVLDARHGDRDLLVSSHTGSGKTVAFGMLIARAAFPEKAAARRRGAPPCALVIVPTRELAAQVRTELLWLFRETGARVHAFTGGTDATRDARTLAHGTDLVIGTPGRLVDLITRGALVLGELKAVVLDEGDQMLDLGFRDELEQILAAAPSGRRTHLFSATLPAPIRALAARYQSEPVFLDSNTASAKSSSVHADIRVVMHLVAPGDRWAAVANVLRAWGGTGSALVFCSRRDRVAGLVADLTERGFDVVGLSGEMAQAERNRALASLREGRVRLLVATNVAARGLDLPEVDLVVHADIPEGPEALVHRSGRTGRAGRKGTSVLIAEASERHRAERLFRMARLPIAWTAAPPAAEIARADRERLVAALSKEASEEPDAAALELADRLLGATEALGPESTRRLVAALAHREWQRLPEPAHLRPIPMDSSRPPRTGPPTGATGNARAQLAQEGVVLFSVNLGSEGARAEPGWLLPLICRRGGVTRHAVGAIRIGTRESTFEIAATQAPAFFAAASEPDPRAPHVVIRSLQKRALAAPPKAGVHLAPSREGTHAPRSRDRAHGEPPKFSAEPAPHRAGPAKRPVVEVPVERARGHGPERPPASSTLRSGGNGPKHPGGDGQQRPGGHGAQRPGGHGAQRPGGHGAQRPGGHGAQRPGGHAPPRRRDRP